MTSAHRDGTEKSAECNDSGVLSVLSQGPFKIVSIESVLAQEGAEPYRWDMSIQWNRHCDGRDRHQTIGGTQGRR